jgi:hypothetical protein
MEISTQFLVLVPVVLGVVQVAKISGLDSRYSPALSLVLGVLGTYLVGHLGASQDIIQGLVVGLTASGLFSGAKTTISA